MNMKIYIVFIAMLMIPFNLVKGQVNLQNPRCEMLVNPLGIDAVEPRLSWEMASAERDIQQNAYRVIVSSTIEKLALDQGDVWDSGKTASDQSNNVVYKGAALKSRKACFWKVKVWTNKGETEWSKPAYWTMGLLNYADWKGRWIGLDKSFAWDNEKQFSRLSARYFRKEFEAPKAIKKATAYLIGLGLYEFYINGKKIGDQVLAPVPTDYQKGFKYNTFDVTQHLKEGKNAIGTILGNGRFYTMRQDYKPYKIKTFGYPKMLLNLDIEYTDGTKQTIITDDSWKVTAEGPILANNEYDGEEYDARKEMPGWNNPGFHDQTWLKAQYVQEAGGMPEAQMNENMKVMETIKPVSLKQLKPGVFIMDMGQNMAGWIKFRVKGQRGQKVTLRFAESLQADGTLFDANLRDAIVTDAYTLKGGATESWEPSFVYHGFRYVEIKGYPGTPVMENFLGQVVYDDIKTTGEFNTSNETINQIYKNAYWGIRGNYKGMPVDCPQRNERQPWLGDRTTGAYGESFMFDNGRLYAKWLDDIQQAQRADGSIPDVAPSFWRYYSDNVTWPGTYLFIADMLYTQFADQQPIRKHYGSMKKWMEYMQVRYTTDGLVTKDKYGDWCVPPESKELIHSKDPARQTDGVLIASATYYKLLLMMENFATMLHQQEDAQNFRALADQMKASFNAKFFNQETSSYSNNTVTANLLPLSHGMVAEQNVEAVFKNIVDKTLIDNKGHISTGVIGTQYLMRGFSDYGRPDISYQLATNRDYPSWGYMVEHGATTIWELWNGNTASPKMNSQNHVMLLGDLLVWYYENLAGIKSAAPGFKQIVMKPEIIKGLNHVNASYQSTYGLIKSNWTKTEERFIWHISIPANTTAIVHLPAESRKAITEKGSALKDLKFVGMENNRALFELGSGDYTFTVENKFIK
ncbi:glycoside hydrolase family 78 protein [Pedobacter immunditicola]|uniref:glycoside hydrolase family 78 protein n=1 Tax=Pedobacter immunditicola TaxID=3133440 RepID=UPI00309F70B2